MLYFTKFVKSLFVVSGFLMLWGVGLFAPDKEIKSIRPASLRGIQYDESSRSEKPYISPVQQSPTPISKSRDQIIFELEQVCSSLTLALLDQGLSDRCKFLLVLATKATADPVNVKNQPARDLEQLDLAQHLQELQFWLVSRLQMDHTPQELWQILELPEMETLRALVASIRNRVWLKKEAEMREDKLKELDATLQEMVSVTRIGGGAGNSSSKKVIFCVDSEESNNTGFLYRIFVAVWCLAAGVSSRQAVAWPKPMDFLLNEEHLSVANDHHMAIEKGSVDGLEWWPSDQKEWTKIDSKEMQHHNIIAKGKEFGFYLPPHLPEALDSNNELYFELIGHEASIWYVGKLMRHLLTPTESFMSELRRRAEHFGISLDERQGDHVTNFTAAIHVRRADKVITQESPLYPLWKYMLVVEELFRQHEVRLGSDLERRVFIATDDPEVILEAKRDFPHYKVLYNDSVASHAGVSKDSLYDHGYSNSDFDQVFETLIDFFLLCYADFAVVTFSSNVGKAVHAMRLARSPRAFSATVSLDMDWYFKKLNPYFRFQALQDHRSSQPGDLSFSSGQVLHSTFRTQLDLDHAHYMRLLNQSWPDGTLIGGLRGPKYHGWNTDVKTGRIPRFKIKPVFKEYLNLN